MAKQSEKRQRFQPHDYAEFLRDSGVWRRNGNVLHRWTGSYWQALLDTDAERAAYHWIVENDLVNASHDNASRAHKAAVAWCEVLPESAKGVVIPCANGYLHVQDRAVKLMPPDPTLGLRYQLPCVFDPDAPPPTKFEAFLRRVLPESDVRERVQEYFGYTLTNDARHQLAQFWVGSGANGKGVLARVLMALHSRPESVQLDALDGFKLSSLIDATLVYCDEAPRKPMNEQIIKSLIAGERVQIDRKYRDPITASIGAKWLVLGNHIPAVTDHSGGFWRRWDFVPFDVVIPEHERNPVLADSIITEELGGVLMWALEGLLRLHARGRFNTVLPMPMARVLKELKGQTDSIRGWLDECDIRLGIDAEATKEEVYAHYKSWCSDNGLSAVASPRFWPRLRDVLPYEERRARIGGVQKRVCTVRLPF